MSTCQYCEHKFSNNDSLRFHQRTAKYCLDIQGKNSNNIIYTCSDCNKQFYQKLCLSNHKKKCIVEQLIKKNDNLQHILHEKDKTEADLRGRERCLLRQLEEYKQQVESLISRLENVAVVGATKSTTTTNNTIKLEMLTDEHLTNCARLLTENDIMSINSIAKFAVKHSLKDRVIATDRARKTLSYKNEDGFILKDPLGRQVANRFFASIKNNGLPMTTDIKDKLIQELKDKGIDMDEADFELLQTKVNDIINIETGIKKCSENEETDIRQEFVEMLCQLIP